MSQQTLLREFKIKGVDVKVFGDKVSMGDSAAKAVAQHLRAAIAQRGTATVVFASGLSQIEFLAALVRMHDVEWSAVTAFHLDEYLGMSDQHPASVRRYLRERLFDHLPFGAAHLLQGDAPDPEEEVRRYAGLLEGGPLDVACIGIGENAHLAFNDPPADFDTTRLVHVVDAAEASRQQQVGEGQFATLDDVPTRALTLSVPAILRAQLISCITPDLRKAQAVRCTLEGPITPQCPGSALRKHDRVYLYLDRDSASLLSEDLPAELP